MPFFEKEYNKKGSILFVGCSFTYGFQLEDNETIEYLIHKKTKRNVINLGICATGIQHILYLLHNQEIYNYVNDNIINKPEYVIYTYFPEHLLRLSYKLYLSPLDGNGYNVRYIKDNNSLKLVKPFFPLFFYKTFILKSIMYNYDQNLEYDEKEKIELFNSILLESSKLLQQHYPGIKFIILRYRIEQAENTIKEYPYMWEIIEKEGFTVLDTEKMIGRKFSYESSDTTMDGYHPSFAAWKLLAPKIIEELNL
jgi:hypothetical protein